MNNNIKSYDYRPHFKFFKTGNEKIEEKKLLIGFELEVENTGECIGNHDLVEGISEIINEEDNQFLYYKKDGSLDYGVEIVSMPFSLNYIKQNKNKIEEVLRYMKNNGFHSHDPGTCGLHFHINKEYFGSTSEEIENNIDKLILFTEYYKEKLIAFSRRNCFDYCHFLGDKRYLDDKQRLNILKVKKEKFNVDRYMVINIENTKTVEFRLIRGTLNYYTFMASIEFVFSLARVIKNKKITDISWDDVIYYEGNEFTSQYCNDRKIKPDSKKMKDYSLDFLKEQNKLKAKVKKNEREIITKVYEILIKNTKEIPNEYSLLFNNIPEKYSGRIKPELLIKKYQSKNSLVLANQYLLDIINSYDNNNYNEQFLRNTRYFLSNISHNSEMKRKLNNIDNEFLKSLDSKVKLTMDLFEKIENNYDYGACPF